MWYALGFGLGQTGALQMASIVNRCWTASVGSLLALAGITGAAFGQGGVLKPEYPQGEPVSRNATKAEREWAALNPYVPPQFDVLEMPQGTLSCPGEYAPSEGIVFAWEGGASLNAIQATMIKHITTTGAAKAFIVCDTASIATTARNACVAQGADTTKIVTIVRTVDTIWLRDYGPRYTYEGDVRVIIDHTYNVLSRTNDNTVPIGFSTFKKHKLYTFPLIHGGGNYHLNSVGQGHYTRLIANENPTYSEAQINTLWQQFWGPTNTYHNPYRTSVDGTQHIDMWMQIVGDNKVIVSDWPNNSGSVEDVISDNAAATMGAGGWTVARTPSFSIGGTHYTYTNMVLCNNLALVPQYTNASITMPNPGGGAALTLAQVNANALATYQTLLGPGYTVVGVPCESIVGLSGVIHCIVMQVPVNKNGVNPGVYVRTPNGGGVYEPGEVVALKWTSDDDVGVTNVDIEYSTDGGGAWTTVASAIADTGSYNWTVPASPTTQGRVRVVARDIDGNTGEDRSDTDFVINPPSFKPALTTTTINEPVGFGTNNGNGRIDPGESKVRVYLTIKNEGVLTGTGVTGVLSSNTPTASVLQPASGYADLAFNESGANAEAFVLSVHGSHPCGEGIACTLTLTSSDGVKVVPVVLSTGLPGGVGPAQQFAYTGAVVAIPDGTGGIATASLAVSGLSGTIADIDFRFDGTTCSTSGTSTTVGLNHSWVGDLRVTLISPTGTQVILIDTPGATGPDTNSGNNFCNTRLDDSATALIQTAASTLNPFTGSFKPANPLAGFNGEVGNGTWQVQVQDILSPDSGSLRRFSLFISPQLAPSCAAALVHCPADIADDAGNALPSGGDNSGANEGDYNLFFQVFFTGDPVLSVSADIADDAGEPLPSLQPNSGVNEGDYNLFFMVFFNC